MAGVPRQPESAAGQLTIARPEKLVEVGSQFGTESQGGDFALIARAAGGQRALSGRPAGARLVGSYLMKPTVSLDNDSRLSRKRDKQCSLRT